MTAHVVVIGAGVTGITAATRLQAAGHRVTIVARDFPAPSETIDPRASINYTSPWGGAHNRWVPPPPPSSPPDPVLARDHVFSVETYRHMDALAAAHPEAGVTFLPGIEYLDDPARCEGSTGTLTVARARELEIEGFRLLDEGELPEGVKWGCTYRTWCVSPMVYLAFLLRRLVLRGGKVVRRELRGVEEAWALEGELGRGGVDVVVNCSGNGFGDENMFITRGQTCLVANPCAATVTRQHADGTWSFCVPRGFDGGTIVGGTKQPNDWSPNPSAAVREHLLADFAATHPAILGEEGKLVPIMDIVGRRPTRRGGMRLEVEEAAADGGRPVVHAYGLGGRGYELSWGVGGRVVELVESALGKASAKL